MLYYFFSIKQKENAYLFDDLEISKNIEVMRYQNQYPVIFITLKDMIISKAIIISTIITSIPYLSITYCNK